MIGGIQNIGRIPELRARILFTFAMLAVYRVGCAVVTPGINTNVIRDFFDQMSSTVFGMFNLFSGGALQQKIGPGENQQRKCKSSWVIHFQICFCPCMCNISIFCNNLKCVFKSRLHQCRRQVPGSN